MSVRGRKSDPSGVVRGRFGEEVLYELTVQDG